MFTRVSHFLAWINTTILSNGGLDSCNFSLIAPPKCSTNSCREFVFCLNYDMMVLDHEDIFLTNKVRSFSALKTKGRHKKKSIFLGKSPKLWVGGGQES